MTAADFLPERRTMKGLREAAAGCRGCDLWENATQTVFGEGPARKSKLMLVGEQPGDREDREGSPFVGPAGRVLDRALADAGIAREEAYVTNVVKHFTCCGGIRGVRWVTRFVPRATARGGGFGRAGFGLYP